MRNPATYRRAAATVGLVLAGVGAAVFIVLAAPAGWDSSHVERLEVIAAAGGRATVSFVAYAAYQLPMLVGLLGVGHLLRGRSPVLANLGASLAGVGAFGYAVYGGSQLVIPAMVADPANLAAHAQVRAGAEALTEPFAMLGMVGSVLGLLLLSVALWRTRTGPRWVPVMVWGWLVIEFVGTSLVPGAAAVSGGLLLLALVSLAVVVGRSPVDAWSSAVDRPDAARVRAAVATAS